MAKFEKINGKVIKKKRKWRFTEVIILVILIYCISIFERSLYYAFSIQSESVWWYVLPATGALASSAFAVFVWKEKNENLPKIKANPEYDQEQIINEIQYDMQQEFQNLEDTNKFC